MWVIILTISSRQGYLPCAVEVAWVVARETRAEDNPTHLRQDSATAGWQHRQSIHNVKHVDNTLSQKFDILLPKREKNGKGYS